MGSFGWGLLSDRVGRRLPFRVILLVSGCAGLAAALAPVWWILLLLLFVNGIGIGGNITIDGAMFAEYCPRSRRGAMLAVLSAFYTGGSLVAASLGWAIIPNLSTEVGWRMLCAAAGVLTLLVSLLRWRTHESPTWLVQAGRVSEAATALNSVVRANRKAEVEPFVLDASPPSDLRVLRNRRSEAKQRSDSVASTGSGSAGGVRGQSGSGDGVLELVPLGNASGTPTRGARSSYGELDDDGDDDGAAGAGTGASDAGRQKPHGFCQVLNETPLLARTAWLLWASWFFAVFGCVDAVSVWLHTLRAALTRLVGALCRYIGLNSFLLILLERRGIFSRQTLYQDVFLYVAAGLIGNVSSLLMMACTLCVTLESPPPPCLQAPLWACLLSSRS